MLNRSIVTLAAGACALALVAGGCNPGRGKYTAEGLQKAQERVSGLKSANEYQQAWQAYTAGDLDKASKAINASLTLNPSVVRSYVLRGRIEIEQGRLEQSLESFKKAEALDPQNVEAHYYQGIVYERFGQPENALTRYMKAVELEPTNAQYALAAAETMMDQGQLAEAEQFLMSRSASLEHNAGVKQTLGHIHLMKGDTKRAAELFGEARLLAPDDTGILEDLVNAQLAGGNFADAEFNLQRLLKVPANKDRRDLRHMRARCLTELDRPVDAREVYAELTQGDAGQRDVEAWIGLGNTSYILRDMLRLRQSGQRVIALAPNRPEGYVLRAWFHVRNNDNREALASLDKAIEHRNGQVEPLLLKAVVLKRMNREAEAEQVIATARKEDPASVGSITAAPIE